MTDKIIADNLVSQARHRVDFLELQQKSYKLQIEVLTKTIEQKIPELEAMHKLNSMKDNLVLTERNILAEKKELKRTLRNGK